jgi:hypothetical protein
MNVPILGVRLDAPESDLPVRGRGCDLSGSRDDGREARGARLADAGQLSALADLRAKNKNRFQLVISTLSEYKSTLGRENKSSLAGSAPSKRPEVRSYQYPALAGH